MLIVSGIKKKLQLCKNLRTYRYAPIRTERYPSIWELSAARAEEVARKLVKAGFNPTQLSIEAFAQYRPKVPNDSRQGRATNRRIEIVYQRGSIRKHMVDILRR